MDPEFSKKCFVILINEIVPRAKKLNMSVSEFIDAEVSGALARKEYDGEITRRDVRKFLDKRVKQLQEIQT